MIEDFQIEIEQFLEKENIPFYRNESSDSHIHPIILTNRKLRIVPVGLSLFEKDGYKRAELLIKNFLHPNQFPNNDEETLFIYQDRWRYNKEQIKQRVLLRTGIFKSVFARNCKVLSNITSILEEEKRVLQKIEKMDSRTEERIKKFIAKHHSLGFVKSPYILALEYRENIVAAATFSKPIVTKQTLNGIEKRFLSFEWTRYVSFADVSVVGAMGKLLHAFLKQISQNQELSIEIMSYSDNEWSGGEAYKKLKFSYIEERPPILHYVDIKSWERVSERIAQKKIKNNPEVSYLKIYNLGSRKWLLHSK